MQKRSLLDRIKRLAKSAYLKLFRINDSPLKIALGFGLGAFVGVMPGVGPVIALFLAFLFRVNRASALLASILFNTWISFVALLLAIKVGSSVMGLNYQDVHFAWTGVIKDFKWEKLFDVTIVDVFVPIGVGYLIISLLFAVVAAVVVYAIVILIRNKKLAKNLSG
jgi:uncharacterized protein (DUF2062 family)